MKFSLMQPFPYLTADPPRGLPVAPRLFDPAVARESMRINWELIRRADEFGFDYISVAEHHYSSRQLSPNPVVTAAAIAQRLHHASVAILGITLPLTNPVRVAEELALLDLLTDGGLLVGFFRGVPLEYTAYGTNPGETRAMFEEALQLVVRAWTEPEPFGWEGRHYRYRNVSLWPQPLTRPHPSILVAGNSPESAAYAARNHLMLGLAYVSVDVAGTLVEHYRACAAETGWTPGPEHVLWRGFGHVADTDDAARSQAEASGFGSVAGIAAPPARQMPATRAIMGEIMRASGAPAGRPSGPPPMSAPPQLLGSPDTVRAQIEGYEQVGVGTIDVCLVSDALPLTHAQRSLELFGGEVLPGFAEPVRALASVVSGPVRDARG